MDWSEFPADGYQLRHRELANRQLRSQMERVTRQPESAPRKSQISASANIGAAFVEEWFAVGAFSFL